MRRQCYTGSHVFALGLNGADWEGGGTTPQIFASPFCDKLRDAEASWLVGTPKEAAPLNKIIAEPSPE